MKIFKLVALGLVLMLAGSAKSQISVRLNLGSPPQWAPVEHADSHYYYLPDVEAYYDVQSSMFIYLDGRRWIQRSYLPYRYRNYDLYSGYKVPMNNYHGNTPYANFNEYKIKYSKGRNRVEQRTIGERPGRGDYGSRYNRENNQVNRGRYDKVNNRGNSKNKNDRRNGSNDHENENNNKK